jgi:hypothetical protein
VKHIDVGYGGDWYSIGARDIDEVQREIDEHLRAGGGWLQVNAGEGSVGPARLYVSPGTPIALLPVAEPPDDEPRA